MKRYFFILIACLCTSFTLHATTHLSDEAIIQSSKALISRVTPGYEKQFILEALPRNEDGLDRFEVSSKENKPLLRGTSPVALATAFNWYLKYTCQAEYTSWNGSQLALPKQLPLPTKSEKRDIQGKYRAYMNYCTLSYTAPWWDWERWQQEIDFMAMNSINMPLQPIGLDAAWYDTLKQLGLNDGEIRGFLVGPAHQAWQWMPNIQGFAEPLPMSWIDSHKVLASQIFARERELGMMPIQQAFTGYVPQAIKKYYPTAKVSKQGEWYGFEGVTMLDPLDPLFNRIGTLFLESQKKLFGAYGHYAADPFHESTPPVSGNGYLNQVGEKIYKLIDAFDPQGTVIMQSWSIREHIINQMPKDRVIVLDLNGSGRTFWGYPFITGNLHNFGGRINLHGNLAPLASNQYVNMKGRASNCVGSGLFMESLVQNRIFYALAFEMPCHDKAVNLDQWISDYAKRNYGTDSESIQRAWSMIRNQIYRNTNDVEFSSMIAARPALRAKKSGPNSGFHIPYKSRALYAIMEELLVDSDKLRDKTLYAFDVMDFQRQIMSNLAQSIHRKAADCYEKKDIAGFKKHVDTFLELLMDLDTLLSSRAEYNVDYWIADARQWGTTTEEKDILEKDGTMLITFWGFTEGYECKQFDYSWREWAGHIRRYYYPRWKMFYDMALAKLEAGTPYVDNARLNHGREAFRANDFYSKLADWEIAYANTPKPDVDTRLKGNTIDLAKEYFAKYKALAIDYGVLPKPLTPIINGTLEGEALFPDININNSPLASQQTWAFWIIRKPNQTLSASLPIAEAGTYDITLNMAVSFDFAIHQLVINGEPIGTPIDSYDSGGFAIKPHTFTNVPLKKGLNTIAFRNVGKNPANPHKRWYLGIDTIVIKKK